MWNIYLYCVYIFSKKKKNTLGRIHEPKTQTQQKNPVDQQASISSRTLREPETAILIEQHSHPSLEQLQE